MTVAKFNQPDFNTQTPADYKANIDSGFAVHNEVSGIFAPHESVTPDMTVMVDAGKLFTSLLIVKAQQTSAVITAPVTNPRIDRIAIDTSTGDVVVITGVESASPVAPDYSANHYPVCQIALASTTTQIFNSLITDERVLVKEPAKPDVVTNHIRAGNMQILTGINTNADDSFSVNISVVEGNWETVGPTGSGANNIWDDLDVVPDNATILLARLKCNITPSSASLLAQLHVFAAAGDVTTLPTEPASYSLARIGYVACEGDSTVEEVGSETHVQIPLNSANIFKIRWIASADLNRSAFLYYKGFMTD